MKAFLASAVGGLVLTTMVGLSVLAGVGGGAGSAAGAALVALCETSGPVKGLDATQAVNARVIVAVTQQVAASEGAATGDQVRAALITLMTAGTESTLHDYANPKVPASELLPNDGDAPTGGDHDSVGLFQQRASWGPLASRMDPAVSTRLFVTRLLSVPAWQAMPPGVAAQTVQQSAYPDRYARLQTVAQGWLTQITNSPVAQACGSDGLPASESGDVPPGAVTPGYAIPSEATDAERRAITFALAQLGKPYIYGATGPDAYDCSGLTMAAWLAAGVQLPHYTVAQYELGVPVADASLVSPGDLIFIPGSDGSLNPPNPQHVGIYIGAGYVVEAPQTGDVIKIVPLAGFKPVIGIRHYA